MGGHKLQVGVHKFLVGVHKLQVGGAILPFGPASRNFKIYIYDLSWNVLLGQMSNVFGKLYSNHCDYMQSFVSKYAMHIREWILL